MRQATWAASVRMMRPIAPSHGTTIRSKSERRRFVARTCPNLGILWLALLANSACGAHKPGNCELKCDQSGPNQCPDGLLCGNDNRCVTDKSVACEGSVGGGAGFIGTNGSVGGGIGTSSGVTGGGTHLSTGGGTSNQTSGGTSGSLNTTGETTGGAIGGGTVGGATGGTTANSSGAVMGGNGGTPVGVGAAAGATATGATGGMGGIPPIIHLTLTPASPWCVGESYNALISADANGSTYSWSSASLPAGITLGVSTNSTNTLTGTPQVAGNFEPAVTVTDGSHQGQLTLTVNEQPGITLAPLGDGCLGEVFQKKLDATNSAELEWTPVSLPAEIGLTLDADGTLHGVIQKTGNFELQFKARNKTTGCTSPVQTVRFQVHGEEAKFCPTIRVKGQDLAATPAPASCIGRPYSTQFDIAGDPSSISWSIVDPSDGFEFDSVTKTLTHPGLTEDTSVTLQVTDTVRKIQRRFSIPFRTKCWLGYLDGTTSDGGAPYSLKLVDPLLGVRVTGPTSDASESVEDFKFSPDGRFVAYRAKAVNGQYTLWLWQGPKWNAFQKMDFGGSVIRYEWSSNSQALAVAVNNGADTLLGGVNVARVPANPSQTQIQDLVMFTPVSAKVDSEMAWYGNDVDGWRVAFHSKKNPDQPQRALYYAALGKDGFSAPSYANRTNYDQSMLLIPNSGGFHALRQSDAILTYFSIKGGPVYHGNVAISPSANFVARANGNLALFHADDDSSLDSSVPWKSLPDCDALLTWSKAVERIACIDTQAAAVRVYSIDASSGEVSSKLIDASAGYAQGGWGSYRRLFSDSGKWLALTTSDHLYLGLWATETPKILWSSQLYGARQAILLSFSPDEQLLALQGDRQLLVFEPEGLGAVPTIADTLLTPASPCQETQLALPGWCGSGRASLPFAWSPNSDLVAFVTDKSVLHVHDLRIRPIALTPKGMDATPTCAEQCQSQFKFQP